MSWRAQISRHVRELRFVACDSSQSSQGLRCVRRCASGARALLTHVVFVL